MVRVLDPSAQTYKYKFIMKVANPLRLETNTFQEMLLTTKSSDGLAIMSSIIALPYGFLEVSLLMPLT